MYVHINNQSFLIFLTAVIALVKSDQEEGYDANLLYETSDLKSVKTWRTIRSILRNYVTNHKDVAEKNDNKVHPESGDHQDKKRNDVSELDAQHPETREEEIKRRRYTAYMSDLENAILYSLTHEIGSRTTIVGPALNALQDYVEVLCKHFPARASTSEFLHQLFQWILGHNDAIRGKF